MEIVVITGISGAGKTSVLDVFEDMGYYSIDNLPPRLLTNFVQLIRDSNQKIDKIAVVTDVRGGIFFDELVSTINTLRNTGEDLSVLYLDADNDTLIRRYKELRRKHPLETGGLVLNGILKEREKLQNIRENSDIIIDTTSLSLGELKNIVKSRFSEATEDDGIPLNLVSFGFKNGILIDADLVFDVRFLPNPYYITALKEKTGKDEKVKDYVFSFDVTKIFIDKIKDLLLFLIPKYKKEGKESLVVGFGCTGGKHRSVVITERLGKELIDEGKDVYISHRDQRFW